MKDLTAYVERTAVQKIFFFGFCCLITCASTTQGQSVVSKQAHSQTAESPLAIEPDDPIFKMLQDRVIENPEDADSWRLIGRLERKRGRLSAAIEATGQALSLDPLNAAAHFDFSELMELSNLPTAAAEHRQKVFAIAPGSPYATELIENGFEPNPAAVSRMASEISDQWSNDFVVKQADGSEIVNDKAAQVGYEVQTFDGGDKLDRGVRERANFDLETDLNFKPLRFFVESGVLYNTNISLTPISWELAQSNAASAQVYAAPELEWTIRKYSDWRYGTIAKGYFTVNEHQWSAFNLANFQPGAFFEKELSGFESDLIGRVDYSYALDIVDGNRLGDRHSLTGSLIQIRPDLDAIYTYLSIAFAQFDDDGTNSQLTSLDGTRLTAGVSRFYRTELARMPTWILGLDVEHAGTEGTNFRYAGLTLHTSTTMQLTPRLSLVPDAGVGGRKYYDFAGPISRDELTWRVGTKLIWRHSDHFSISIVAGHNRFASDNAQFDAERSLIGIVTTFVF